MDTLSHTLWANLLLPENPLAVTIGSIMPDILGAPNWLYRFITGKGTFWKTKKDLIGLSLGIDRYAEGYKYVNRGPLYRTLLFLNSIFALIIVWILALKINSFIINKNLALAYTFHLVLDVFTHKNSECIKPFWPISNLNFNPGVVRWGLQPNWYVVLNFVLLGILYFLKFIN
jgi:membrane-bound metal-dependent hydrolase YbcI (DUF457 family)